MSSITALGSFREITPDAFTKLVAKMRGRGSDAGERISYGELKSLFAAAGNARQVGYAVGQAGITIADLKGIAHEMLKDGVIDAKELTDLFEAAIAPKNAAEAGASVSKEEVELFNGLDQAKMTPEAKSLMNERIAPRLSAMLDEPARTAGVRVRGSGVAAIADVLPRRMRTANASKMLVDKQLAPDATSGYGAATARLVPLNFEIGGKSGLGDTWYSGDSLEHYSPRPGSPAAQQNRSYMSWQENDHAWGNITKMPADGILDLSMMMHPSGHHDSDGGTNSWDFARQNLYDIFITTPKKNIAITDIRNGPMGPSDSGRLSARGGEEYTTVQDLKLDVNDLKGGDVITIEMRPQGSGAYSTQRIYDLVLPKDWKPKRR